MAYDENLTQQMRAALASFDGITEKRMMGGICFFLHGNMISGADRTRQAERRYMFRVGKGNDAASALPGGVRMIQGNRPMTGFYFVNGDLCDDTLLKRWLDVALNHARGLPPK